MTAVTHRWQFSRSGGFDQVRLESAADLANLEHLDQKLWAALACPVKGLEFDERTLALIDSDHDGRVRAPEVIAAVQWCEEHLVDLGALKAGAEALPLAQILTTTAPGKALLASARRILKDLGKGDAPAISLADVTDTARLFAQTRFNGDGIVPADAAGDGATRRVLEELLACLGGPTDRSGKAGVDRAHLARFFAECAALAEWAARGEKEAAIRPLGDATAAAFAAFSAVRAKVDDYFARCRLAAFDGRALAALNRREEEFYAVAAGDMTITAQEVAGFPLARIAASRPLPLLEGLNPAWAPAMTTLRSAAIEPLLGQGRTVLTAEEWTALGARLAPHATWQAARPVVAVESLGLPRVREILAGPSRASIEQLLVADEALAAEFQAIAQVERLVRYHRDLYRLLCNFVNFADFYSPERPAIFQAGTLYLDARACELCVRVEDAGKHAALAGLSKAWLAYCDCTRHSGEKLNIAAAFTGGDSDNLMVGRNGLFYDRHGRDWDATITKVIENPISVRQAFWSPYKKLVRMIEELAARRAAAAEAESDAKVAAAAAGTEPPPAEKKRIDVGTVAAISVAIAGIGALITTLIGYASGLFTLPFWKLCLAAFGILMVVSGPSMLIAWLKLRQRNLGPILDANGWAVNGRVKLNVKFGASLTSVAALPPGSLPAADPFGDRPSPWPKLVVFVIIAWFVVSFSNSQGWIRALTKEGTAWHAATGITLGDARPEAEVPAAEPAPAEGAETPPK